MKKKFFAIILSLILVVTMVPLSVLGGTNSVDEMDNGEPEYGTHEYWKQKYPDHRHIPAYIVPGRVFEKGTYFIDKDITVEATEEGQSGIVIKGDVTFVIEDGHTLDIKGADATCSKNATEIKGSGAGIELTKENSLWIKGKGTVNVQSGDVKVSDYTDPLSHETKEVTCGGDHEKTTPDDTGKGGEGGTGTGGVGAAIGTPGGAGGKGASATDGRHDGSIFKDYDGRDGANGQNGQASANAGILKVSGAVKVNTTVGDVTNYKNTFGRADQVDKKNNADGSVRRNGISAGGGAGGKGGSGSQIGSGGSGGAGGGAGGSGGVVSKTYRANGGGGGAGAGADRAHGGSKGNYVKDKGDRDYRIEDLDYEYENQDGSSAIQTINGGAGGCGAHGGDNPGGDGGNGGDTSYAGNPGKCYATTLDESEAGEKSVNGCSAPVYHVYPADECEAVYDIPDGDTLVCKVYHIPTGNVLDKSDYQAVYNKDKGSVTVSGINRGTEENPVFTLADESMENVGELSAKLGKATKITVKSFFQDLTSDGKNAADTYTENVDLERVETAIVGQLTAVKAIEVVGFTATPIQQKIAKEDGSTVIEIYYNRNVHNVTFKEGLHGAWPEDEYVVPVCYGAFIWSNLPECYNSHEEGWLHYGWSPDLDLGDKMGDEDMEFTASWGHVHR